MVDTIGHTNWHMRWEYCPLCILFPFKKFFLHILFSVYIQNGRRNFVDNYGVQCLNHIFNFQFYEQFIQLYFSVAPAPSPSHVPYLEL